MTQVQTRRNEYQHEVVDCPFCEGWVYLRAVNHTSPDPLRDLKRHITTQAKNEAFEMALTEPTGERLKAVTKHLMYAKMHYDWKPQRNGTLKRQYDNDLHL